MATLYMRNNNGIQQANQYNKVNFRNITNFHEENFSNNEEQQDMHNLTLQMMNKYRNGF